MSSLTVDQLFNAAYGYAGLLDFEQVGLGADETEQSRQTYNSMVDAWRSDGLTVSHIQRLLFQLIPNQGDYTIGEGGDFDTAWPDRVERAGIVLTEENPQPEYKLYQLTIDEYQEWVLKGQSTNWPFRYWYERSFPLGILHFLYIPTDTNQVALYLEEHILPINTTGNAIIEYQPGYQEAIETNLAVRLAMKLPRAQLKPGVEVLARSSLALIKNANNRPLVRESDLGRQGGRTNIWAGNRWGGVKSGGF